MIKKITFNKIIIRKSLVYVSLYILTFGIMASVFFLKPEQRHDFSFFRLIIIFFATVLLTKYFVYMVISPWHDVAASFVQYKQNKKLKKDKKKYEPRVSVLVPAWNEEDGVITTAKALLDSSYKNMEIIIINNASTDNTERNVINLIEQHKKNIQFDTAHIDLVYFKESKQGKGNALNRGIYGATGEIIISIDADCYVPPHSIQNFVNYFKDPKVMAAVGNVKIGNTQTLIGVIQHLEFLFSFYFKRGDSLIGSIYIIGGAAGAFRREVFEKLGGYNTTNITEDIELSMRIQDAGMKIVYAPDAVVYTEGAADLSGLMKQRLRWKRGRFETFLEYHCLFFSINKKHNKFLTWIVLPLAIFGELQLSLEPIFLLFLYVYSYLTDDYSSFISGIIVVSSMFMVQIALDSNKKARKRLLVLAPIGWLLLYISTFVEFNAFIRAAWGYKKGKKVEWQSWKRTGVF